VGLLSAVLPYQRSFHPKIGSGRLVEVRHVSRPKPTFMILEQPRAGSGAKTRERTNERS
jgi:hypothetical protein